MIDLVEQRDVTVPLTVACRTLGVSRATLYRRRQFGAGTVVAMPGAMVRQPRRQASAGLTEAERKRVLDVLCSAEFADQPPSKVYGTPLDRGQHLASVRTMYRILACSGGVRERRNVRGALRHPVPRVIATTSNEVWTWDITKVATCQNLHSISATQTA